MGELASVQCSGLAASEEAFLASIFAQYRPMVWAVCARMLRDPMSIEDAVQDTFVSVIRSISAFRVDEPLGPWLTTIARHRCQDQLRRRGRRPEVLVDVTEEASREVPSGESGVDLRVILDLERSSVADAIGRLPHRQRWALGQFAIEGWSYEQIGSALGVSTPAVKSLIHRARTAVRASCGAAGVPWSTENAV